MTVGCRLGVLLLVANVAACNGISAPWLCTDELRPALSVDIRDAASGEFVGAGARAIAVDGSYADTAFAEMTAFPYHLAFERAGSYTVTVERSGYQTWTRSAIVVSEGRCHVQTVVVIARLQR
jgi:hypothetical protein